MSFADARALIELRPATLRPNGSATRSSSVRAGRMSRREESRLAENGLASDQPRTKRLTPELSRPAKRVRLE